jgi:uncharacterized protein
MLIKREMYREAIESLKTFPILVITGARQTGKTTLAKRISDKPYFNLESPDTRDLVINDPRLFLSRISKTGAIIDEFQRVPELASYLQVTADNINKNGHFILTGSNNFLLMEKVSQSLAGRAAILHLPPFTIREISFFNLSLSSDELLYRGFYPSIYSENRHPTKAYNSYYQTYIERDVRQLINIKDLHLFQRFIRLCAGRTSQVLNYEKLANETGTSAKTIKSWLTVLEASYLVFLLPPFSMNISKRVVKSPKIYFYDTGLASYLLGIEEPAHIKYHPLRGALFENMVISEHIKSRLNKGMPLNSFYYRDNHQNEVDLVIQSGNKLTLAEIKSSQTYHTSFANTLHWLSKELNTYEIEKIVLYDGLEEWSKEGMTISNYKNYFLNPNYS